MTQPDGRLALVLTATMLAGIGHSAADMISWSMVADVADEDELASGERREGIHVGVFTFLRKIAGVAVLPAARINGSSRLPHHRSGCWLR